MLFVNRTKTEDITHTFAQLSWGVSWKFSFPFSFAHSFSSLWTTTPLCLAYKILPNPQSLVSLLRNLLWAWGREFMSPSSVPPQHWESRNHGILPLRWLSTHPRPHRATLGITWDHAQEDLPLCLAHGQSSINTGYCYHTCICFFSTNMEVSTVPRKNVSHLTDAKFHSTEELSFYLFFQTVHLYIQKKLGNSTLNASHTQRCSIRTAKHCAEVQAVGP